MPLGGGQFEIVRFVQVGLAGRPKHPAVI